MHLTLEQVHALTNDALVAHGCSDAQAGAIARNITAAERDGAKSHGMFRIPFYVDTIAAGEVDPAAAPELRELAPGVIQVDGRSGFAPLAQEVGIPALVDRARTQGIAALAIVDACHIAAMWPEVEAIAAEGLVGLAVVNASAFVAPAGGTKPLYGTNPMGFAWPRAGGPPLVFDQAASVSARGEIQLHERDGRPIPEGWGIDPDGRPTTDPSAVLAGAQLPFGGYKGASIALMIELLAGAMIGSPFSFESSERLAGSGAMARRGEFLIAIDPARCVPGGDRAAQLAHAERLFERILAQEGARLPSTRRFAARERTPREGVEIPDSLHEAVAGLAKR